MQTTSPAPAEAPGGGAQPPRGEARAAVLGRPAAGAFVAPALLLIAGFLVFPALWTLYLGLTDYRLTGAAAVNPSFVGLDNYTQALADPQFRNSLLVTALFVFGSAVVGQTCLGFALAWTMRDWRSPLRAVVEVLVIVAWILPGSVVAFLWIAFLDGQSGTLNALLPGVSTEWLLETPLLAVIVFNVWRGTAFSMLLYGAALSAVPPSHLETARLAGASAFQQLRDVVLPTIRGHILTSLLLISLWTFNDFTPYLLTRGGPNFRPRSCRCSSSATTPTLAARPAGPTLANFRDVFQNRLVLTSLRNSLLLALYAMVLVVAAATLAAYALSRVRLPGRDLLLYVLLLFSSVVSGTAAMVPLFLLVFELGLINTYLGVTLVLTGGLLPAAIFILKDFTDTTPTSYEESARVFGASPFQILKDVVVPLVRPGMAVIAVWTLVNVWGNFLIPFILLRDPNLAPASVVTYSFYTEGGQADLRLLSAFSLLYSVPVVVMYLFVQRRYGFRFYGGIKR